MIKVDLDDDPDGEVELVAGALAEVEENPTDFPLTFDSSDISDICVAM